MGRRADIKNPVFPYTDGHLEFFWSLVRFSIRAYPSTFFRGEGGMEFRPTHRGDPAPPVCLLRV